METVDLDKLATIIESPAVTEARRRRFAQIFAAPAMLARPTSEASAPDGADLAGLASANVHVGPWRARP